MLWLIEKFIRGQNLYCTGFLRLQHKITILAQLSSLVHPRTKCIELHNGFWPIVNEYGFKFLKFLRKCLCNLIKSYFLQHIFLCYLIFQTSSKTVERKVILTKDLHLFLREKKNAVENCMTFYDNWKYDNHVMKDLFIVTSLTSRILTQKHDY